VLGGDAQGLIRDHFGGALDVALVLEPLAVAHVGTETTQKRAASESGIFPEELTGKLQRSAPVRVAHLVEFFLDAHKRKQSRRKPQSRAR